MEGETTLYQYPFRPGYGAGILNILILIKFLTDYTGIITILSGYNPKFTLKE